MSLLLCVYLYLGMCTCVWMSGPLELELQVVGSQYAGAGNQAQLSARAVHSALEPICSMKWEGWEQEKNCR